MTTDEIPVTSLYKYDEERWGTQAIRFLSFANDRSTNSALRRCRMGLFASTAGRMSEGHLSYVGAMDVKYIPVGEKIELNLGRARLVEVKPVLMDCRNGEPFVR